MNSSFRNKDAIVIVHRVIEILFFFLLLIQNGAISSLPSPVCSTSQQERPLEARLYVHMRDTDVKCVVLRRVGTS